MNKLWLWFVNSTLSIVLICFVSVYFGLGELGAYTNTTLVLIMALAFVFVRRGSISNAWIHVCVATLFATCTAATALTLGVVVMRPENIGSPEWRFFGGLVAAIAFSSAVACTAFFALAVAKDFKVKFPPTLSFFTVQGMALYVIFRYVLSIVNKFFGS